MNTELKQMLHLFACGATGKSPKAEMLNSVGKAVQLARIQHCLPVVLEALKQNDWSGFSEKTAEQLHRLYEEDIVTNYYRFVVLMDMLQEFENADITYAVLKGYAIAPLYYSPFSRVSSDIDLLVNPADEKRAAAILLKSGYVLRQKRLNYQFQSVFVHEQFGILELHISPFSRDMENIWFFSGAPYTFSAQYKKISLSDCSFYVMQDMDHLLFMFMHILKHFISGGLSIRAIMDFTLAYQKMSDEAQQAAFWHEVEKLHAVPFCAAMLAFMEKYCDMQGLYCPAPADKTLVERLCVDLETGGWLGLSKGVSDGTKEMFTEEKRRLLGISKRMLSKDKRTFLEKMRRLFPTYGYLCEKYPFCNRSAWLYPAAWMKRNIEFVLRHCVPWSRFYRESQAVRKKDAYRMLLMREFGLLETTKNAEPSKEE